MIAVGRAHAAALAAIHAAAFPPGEQWDAGSMAEMLAMPGAFGFVDHRGGFILARRAAGEAEILTLAVHPVARRQGLGSALVQTVLTLTLDDPVFLEVAAANLAARTLYEACGFAEAGHRRDYYGAGRDAVVLRR